MNKKKYKGKDIKKILELGELCSQANFYRRKNKKIVLCHGTFDLLHIGHIRHLERAKLLGDILVVSITADQFVNKGPNRPLFNEQLRSEAIAALGFVDFVTINNNPISVQVIEALKPHFYVKGSDYKDRSKDITRGIFAEEKAVKKAGGIIKFTDEITFSSTGIINDSFPIYPKEVVQYLTNFKKKYSLNEVIDWIEKTSNIVVTIVGDSILDEYIWCKKLGLSSKDPMMAVQKEKDELFIGGSLAVANHLATFCKQVNLITLIGEKGTESRFIKKSLLSNINAMLLRKENSPTLRKSRIIDEYSGNKLFEIYDMNDSKPNQKLSKSILKSLTSSFKGSDICIVTDYGHGMIDKPTIDFISRQKVFLAINVQTNAGNRGFNPISKYRRADFICLAGYELEMETRIKNIDLRLGMKEVLKKIKCDNVTVTQGKDGSVEIFQGKFYKSPAMTLNVVDRVGAGDAYLSVSSLLKSINCPVEISQFLSNVAGSCMVSQIGNKRLLEKESFIKSVTSLLK